MGWSEADYQAHLERLKIPLPKPPPQDPDKSPIEIILLGHVPSKKNAYTPRGDGRGMFKNEKLQTMINRLAVQIPGKYCGLRLVSPDIAFYFTYEEARWDRDGAVVTILDILVSAGVLRNDNLASCNGLISIHPAVRGEYDQVRIVITPA